MQKKTFFRQLKAFLMMNLGVLLLGIGVYFFKIPNGFSTGGVSGIGTILGPLTPISPGTWILLINLLLLVLGFLLLGRKTGAKTVYCSLAFSALTWALERLVPLEGPISGEPLLELVYAILLTAIGSAILFYYNASSGGTDIVALILKKYTSIDVGRALLYSDFLIAAASFLVFGVEIGLFSLLGLFAKAILVDGVIDNLYASKYFVVITEKKDEVTDYILRTLHHGATVHAAEGVFTGTQKSMVHTVCKRIEAIQLRAKIRELDPHAFIIITTSSEIIGRGFRSV